MGSDITDLFRQIPIQIILIPIVAGTLYIISMVVIFRRAAERRRRRALAEYGVVTDKPVIEKPKNPQVTPLTFLRGELPDKPFKPASWTVPTELRGVPEPDLELLTSPVALAEPDVVNNKATAPDTILAAPEFEWLTTALVPHEETMPTSSKVTPDSSGGLEDAVEVMRILRDLNDGSLIIQIGNQRYRSPNDIQNPDLARRFTAVIRELWMMINGSTNRNRLGEAADSGIVGMKTRAATLLNPDSEPSKPMLTRGRSASNVSTPPTAVPPGGIVGSVEEFLQTKLSVSPQFAARSIHIRPSHDHGIKIDVDGHYYDRIDEVVDPDVREFLFSLMREWEARQ